MTLIEFRSALGCLSRRQNLEIVAARLSHGEDDEAFDRYSRAKIARHSDAARKVISAIFDVIDKQIRNPSVRIFDWDD